MNYVLTSEKFLLEMHHMLSGKNELGVLTKDIADFVRYQMFHSTKKKKEHDTKKHILYYRWDFPEIAKWFEEQKREFNYPVFLVEAGSTISIKVSVGRLVKGRRHEHKQDELLRTKGNERASHSTKITNKETKSRNHIIYLNTYFLSREYNMEVNQFIKSDAFEKELEGTVRHELMHAYDTYKIPEGKRAQIDLQKKIYKDYRAKHKIGKEYLRFDGYGEWNGNNFVVDENFVNNGEELKTFYFVMLYYLTDTEMHSYLQTFWNQMCITADKKNGYDSEIYKRYHIIKSVLKFDKISNETIARTLDNEFVKGMSQCGPKLKTTLAKLTKDNQRMVYENVSGLFLRIVEEYIKKLNKLLYDISEMYGK